MAVYDINRILVPDAPPEYEDHTRDVHYVPAPCQVACPIGTDAPSYIAYIWDEDYEGAFEAITATNPFSSICRRVCDAPCEPACRRVDSDGAVQIRNLKRFVMDKLGATYRPPAAPVTRKGEHRHRGRGSGRAGGRARPVRRRLRGARLRKESKMTNERLEELASLLEMDAEKFRRIYNLMLIETLSETKEKILRWLGTWAVILAVVTSVLAAFGIDQLIANRVVTQVNEQIDSNTKLLRDSVNSMVSQIMAQVSEEEERLEEKIAAVNSTMNTTNSALSQANKLMQSYKDKMSEIEPLAERLVDILKDEDELTLFLYNIKSDFYTIKTLKAHINIEYTEDIHKLEEMHGFSRRILTFDMLDLQHAETKDVSVAQFVSITRGITTVGSRNIAYELELFAPYREGLTGEPINGLEIGSLRVRNSASTIHRANEIMEAYGYIKSARIIVSANGIRMIDENIDNFVFQKSDGDSEITATYTLAMGQWNAKEAFDSAISRQLEETRDVIE